MLTGLILAGAFAAGQTPTIAPPCYEGRIGSGPTQRHVIVEAATSDSAIVHLFGRPARRIAVLRKSNSLFRSADGNTAVTLTSNRASLTMPHGTDTITTSLALHEHTAATDDALGEWHGRVGPGGVIRLIARLEKGPCGIAVGVLDSPDQGQTSLPLTGAQAEGDSLILEASYMGLRIALPLAGGDVRMASFTQGAVVSAIELRRGEGTARRPQEPTRPLPYEERAAEFASRASGIRIAGTLTLPSSPGPHPAVVFISGSGAQDRDETIAGHKPFLVLSDYLTRRGYAVLRTDDRGVGKSNGNVLQTRLPDLANDVRGAVDFLRAVKEIDGRRIGLLGHSEGGYVAPVVAAADTQIAFVIMMGGPAVSGRDVFVAQSSLMARASGTSALEVHVDSLMRAQIFAVLDKKPRAEELEGAVDAALTEWQRNLPLEQRTIAKRLLSKRTSAQDSASLNLWNSPLFQSLYHHDPAPYFRRMRSPILALYGELDLQVPGSQSGPALERLFSGARRSLLTLHYFPRVNHLMQTARTGRMDEYVNIEETIADVVLERIGDWLTRH